MKQPGPGSSPGRGCEQVAAPGDRRAAREWLGAGGFLPCLALCRSMLRLPSFAIALAWLAALLWPTSATSSSPPEAQGCFDALVVAKVVGQVPSDFPDSDDDYIVMSWPYFIDLDIEQVAEGHVEARKITALSVQHTYWRSDLGARRWWLRRNTAGGYNILRIGIGAEPMKCPQGTAPDRAYLEPPAGQTLDEMRKAGERRYGSRP